MPQWLTIPANEKAVNLHMAVRGVLPPCGDGFVLRVCAHDRYMLWIDGVYSGQGPVPSYPETAYFDSYKIPCGRSVTIALHIYCGGLENRVCCGAEKPEFCVSVSRDGSEMPLGTDIWRYCVLNAYSGGIAGYDTQFLEDFDSSIYPYGWQLPDFADGGWERLVTSDCAAKFLSRPIKPLCEYKLKAVAERRLPDGFILDFGKEITGNLYAKAEGKAGSVVTLRFGEELANGGRVRYDMRCGCKYEEKWTLGGGVNVLEQFDYKAFRYAEIIFGGDVSVTEVCASVRHYPIDENLCELSCPSGELEDIFKICKNAVKCCTQEGYLDCPTREKGQYLGDAIITARSQVWLTGSTEMLRKCIRDFIASAEIFPALLAVAPCSLRQRIADFSLLFPLLPLTDYEFTGDKAFLRECYPTVKEMLGFFKRYKRSDGLLENVKDLWNLVDWSENMRDNYDFPLPQPVVGDGCHNAVNALWVGANILTERVGEILDIPAEKYSEPLKKAFVSAFYRPDSRLFADSTESSHCSLHANIYAAYFDLFPDGENGFAALMEENGRFCGAFPIYFAMRALARIGRHDVLWRVLTRDGEHGWRNMLREGATA
ncbi:MAG: family 78 glycoside hydrolase catalytic domain, partial [Ruminococcus sp.]|nr:family 78 glycoside hydrolase catalytic domain [Ruminococcus sp.]